MPEFVQGSIKEQFEGLSNKFDVLPISLRALIAVMLFLVVFTFWNAIFRKPQAIKQMGMRAQIKSLQASLNLTQIKSRNLLSGGKDSAGGSSQQLQSEIQSLAGKLTKVRSVVSSVTNMSAVLQDVFRESKGLKLTLIKNLPSAKLISGGPGIGDVYRHQLEVVFDGDYFNTLSFIRHIESLKTPTFFDDLDYTVTAYPMAKIVMHLHTLSSAKDVS